MSTGDVDMVIADEDVVASPASPARVENPGHEVRRPWQGFSTRANDGQTTPRPTWATRLAFAGMIFVAVGAALVVGVLLTQPLQNLDVLFVGVTLAVSGMVLRSIAKPVEIPDLKSEI